jgi:hypothetical protein
LNFACHFGKRGPPHFKTEEVYYKKEVANVVA